MPFHPPNSHVTTIDKNSIVYTGNSFSFDLPSIGSVVENKKLDKDIERLEEKINYLEKEIENMKLDFLIKKTNGH